MVIISNVCKYYVDIPRPRVNTMLTYQDPSLYMLPGFGGGGNGGDGGDGDGSFCVQLWL